MYKKLKSTLFSREQLNEILVLSISVLVALLIGALILLMSDKDPILAYRALFIGSFGNITYLGDTLVRSTPVIFTGLSVAFAYKCGLFNIGVEGQMLIGAIAGAIAGYGIHGLPSGIHILVCLIIGGIMGGIWIIIPAILKVFKGVHEVITTIMMNYIAYSLIAYIINVVKETPDLSQTPHILNSAQIPKIGEFISMFADTQLNLSFILAIICSVLAYFIINKTVVGYEIRAVGISKSASQNAGINVSKNIIIAMIISGVLAGLAGCTEVLGIEHSYVTGLCGGYGFEGIAVAFLANGNPIGIIFSGIIFGALSSGGLYMDMAANIPKDITLVIQGLIVFFIASNGFIKYILNGKRGGT